MVLESLIDTAAAKRHPLAVFLLALAFSSAAFWMAFFTFPDSASILAIAFITIAFVPIIHSILAETEEEESLVPSWSVGFLKRHFPVIKIYAWLFLGVVVSYSFWFVILPGDVRSQFFQVQEKELGKITTLKSTLSGDASGVKSVAANCGREFTCWFNVIFMNNATVLFWAVLFSFALGAGAIFLISWNASIIGVVIGRDIMALSSAYSNLGEYSLAAAFFHGLFNAIGFIPHGLPEITGYFFGAIAGGIISAAISKKKFRTHEFETIAKDAAVLVMAGILLLLLGAAIEASIIAAI